MARIAQILVLLVIAALVAPGFCASRRTYTRTTRTRGRHHEPRDYYSRHRTRHGDKRGGSSSSQSVGGSVTGNSDSGLQDGDSISVGGVTASGGSTGKVTSDGIKTITPIDGDSGANTINVDGQNVGGVSSVITSPVGDTINVGGSSGGVDDKPVTEVGTININPGSININGGSVSDNINVPDNDSGNINVNGKLPNENENINVGDLSGSTGGSINIDGLPNDDKNAVGGSVSIGGEPNLDNENPSIDGSVDIGANNEPNNNINVDGLLPTDQQPDEENINNNGLPTNDGTGVNVEFPDGIKTVRPDESITDEIKKPVLPNYDDIRYPPGGYPTKGEYEEPKENDNDQPGFKVTGNILNPELPVKVDDKEGNEKKNNSFVMPVYLPETNGQVTFPSGIISQNKEPAFYVVMVDGRATLVKNPAAAGNDEGFDINSVLGHNNGNGGISIGGISNLNGLFPNYVHIGDGINSGGIGVLPQSFVIGSHYPNIVGVPGGSVFVNGLLPNGKVSSIMPGQQQVNIEPVIVEPVPVQQPIIPEPVPVPQPIYPYPVNPTGYPNMPYPYPWPSMWDHMNPNMNFPSLLDLFVNIGAHLPKDKVSKKSDDSSKTNEPSGKIGKNVDGNKEHEEVDAEFNKPDTTSGIDIPSINVKPTESSSKDIVSTEKPTESSTIDIVVTEKPTESSWKDNVSTEKPTDIDLSHNREEDKDKTVDPGFYKPPVTDQPIETIVTDKIIETVATEKPTENEFNKPVVTKEPVDPTVTEKPAKHDFNKPTGAEQPIRKDPFGNSRESGEEITEEVVTTDLDHNKDPVDNDNKPGHHDHGKDNLHIPVVSRPGYNNDESSLNTGPYDPTMVNLLNVVLKIPNKGSLPLTKPAKDIDSLKKLLESILRPTSYDKNHEVEASWKPNTEDKLIRELLAILKPNAGDKSFKDMFELLKAKHGEKPVKELLEVLKLKYGDKTLRDLLSILKPSADDKVLRDLVDILKLHHGDKTLRDLIAVLNLSGEKNEPNPAIISQLLLHLLDGYIQPNMNVFVKPGMDEATRSNLILLLHLLASNLGGLGSDCSSGMGYGGCYEQMNPGNLYFFNQSPCDYPNLHSLSGGQGFQQSLWHMLSHMYGMSNMNPLRLERSADEKGDNKVATPIPDSGDIKK